MRKLFALILALALSLTALCACEGNHSPDNGDDKNTTDTNNPANGETEEEKFLKANLSADGFVKGKIGDFSVYENTSAYRVVTTAEELIQAIKDAKCHYKNVWSDETSSYIQEPADGYTTATMEGTVHVIEIANDLNLGYYTLSSAVKTSGIVDDFAKKLNDLSPYLYISENIQENGISQIKVENTSNLLIYSKNGAKLTHCGFKLTSDNNVVFRNLQFDEMWQWEDGNTQASKIGDYDWFGWAYFKIAFCGYIWIDHCSFGKSYDGQIDVSNPVYDADAGTAFRAPYGADGKTGVHISWCDFNAGDDDENGYIYKMMQKIEEEYTASKGADGEPSKHAYYDALRDSGVSFEDILYGLALPQKKGFLCGDSGDKYEYNLRLNVSFANCNFTNLEDRLPKLRGGNAYMYNCTVDCSQYYEYRTKLRAQGCASVVSRVNSSWKCALVSQGIVCGNGGSVKAENCVFKGIEYLLKNNDSNTADKVNGGYRLINCSYQRAGTETTYIGSSSDAGNTFTNDTPAKLKTDLFSWHTDDGEAPFTVTTAELEKLPTYINEINAKIKNGTIQINYLKPTYEI